MNIILFNCSALPGLIALIAIRIIDSCIREPENHTKVLLHSCKVVELPESLKLRKSRFIKESSVNNSCEHSIIKLNIVLFNMGTPSLSWESIVKSVICL